MALFRNLSVYSLPGGWAVSLPQLVGMLEQHQFVPTTDLQAESTGWAPVHEGYGLVHEVQGHLLLRQRTESRVMPTKAIDLQVQEAAAKVEEAQGYKPGKKQRKEIRERVIDQMLPAAFRQQDDVLVWIDTYAGRLGIDSASSGPRDAAVALLCESIDHFALDRLSVRTAAAGAMTAWLADDEAPEGFTIDTLADLRAAGEGAGAVQYVNRPLDPAEVRHHIQSGMQCTRLALTWQDRISFVLDDELVLKRIVPADVVQMDVERSAKTEAEEFEADFSSWRPPCAAWWPTWSTPWAANTSTTAKRTCSAPAPARPCAPTTPTTTATTRCWQKPAAWWSRTAARPFPLFSAICALATTAPRRFSKPSSCAVW